MSDEASIQIAASLAPSGATAKGPREVDANPRLETTRRQALPATLPGTMGLGMAKTGPRHETRPLLQKRAPRA